VQRRSPLVVRPPWPPPSPPLSEALSPKHRYTARTAHWPASGGPPHRPAPPSQGTLADSALSPSSFHHVRLGHLGARLVHQQVERPLQWPVPSPASPPESAPFGPKEPLRRLHVVPRVVERCTEVEVRGWACRDSARWPRGRPWLLSCASRPWKCTAQLALSDQLVVRVARLRSDAGLLFRLLAFPPLPLPAILRITSAAALPPCGTPRAFSKRLGSPGS
jgi:hypothetical protein